MKERILSALDAWYLPSEKKKRARTSILITVNGGMDPSDLELEEIRTTSIHLYYYGVNSKDEIVITEYLQLPELPVGHA